MSKKIELTEKEKKDLIHSYTVLNLSTLKIAEQTGYSKLTVNRLLKESGVELRKSGKPSTGFDKKEYDKTYSEKNKEKKSEYYKEWREKNGDSRKEYYKEWRRKKNEDK